MAQYLWQYKDGTTGSSDIDPAGGNAIFMGRSDGDNSPAFGLWGNTTNSGAAPMQSGGSPVGQQPSFWGGGGGGSFGGNTSGINPYLQQQADSLKAGVNQNLKQQMLPAIRSSALANGSFGSSRQGIAEGVAAGNASTGIAGALASLYSGAYNTDQANQTSRMGIGANYSLGMGGLQNSATAQNQGFYTSQRGQDLQQQQLGAALYGQGISGQTGVGAGQYSVGQQGYQAPQTALQTYSNFVSPYTGLNSATQISGGQNLGVNGILGSGLAGAQLSKNIGNFWGGTNGSANAYTGTNDFSGVNGGNALGTWSQYGTGAD